MAPLLTNTQPPPTKRQVDDIITHLKELRKSNETLIKTLEDFINVLCVIIQNNKTEKI